MKTSKFVVIAFFLMSAVSVSADEKSLLPPFKTFKVENDRSEPKTVTVTTVTRYEPKTSAYVVRGKVRYENVEGTAYLEMWNILPDGSRYFSRTLGDFGPMKKISGTSGLRDFELPFNLMDAKPEYVELEINVVMPGPGKIELSSLELSDIDLAAFGSFGMVGGLLGGVGGLFGAVYGISCSLLIPRGRGRRFLVGMTVAATLLGVVMLVLGLAALATGRPFDIWYPLILTGGMFLVLFPTLGFTVVRKGYRQAELRKMQALDS